MKRRLFTLLALSSMFFSACQQNNCPMQFMKPHQDGLLRIASNKDFDSFDPRKARSLESATALHLLFEGLMRINAEGQPELALAKSINVSPDGKIYTIKLKEAYWSDGDRITAEDFIYSWKSMLDPDFPAPNAYQLFTIRNARQVKAGKAFKDEMGVFAPNNSTLVIELEAPDPTFLQLLATHFYYPINRTWATDEQRPANMPTNGPFVLKEHRQNESAIFVKNEKYRDKENVNLKQIEIATITNSNTGLQLYNKDDLDWFGSPTALLPLDTIASLKEEGCLESIPADGVAFLRVNTSKPALSNAKIRKALSLAINRQSLTDKVIGGNQKPTTALIPANYGLEVPSIPLYDPQAASKLLDEGLKEMGKNRGTLDKITICYNADERNQKISQYLQEQWKVALGLPVELISCESGTTYGRIKSGDYDLAIGSWFADIHDPVNYLDVFRAKNNGTNNTGWENPEYQILLENAATSTSSSERNKLLSDAQVILLENQPIIPLYEYTYNYLKKPRVKDVYFSNLGYLDFTNASLRRYTIDENADENSTQ